MWQLHLQRTIIFIEKICRRNIGLWPWAWYNGKNDAGNGDDNLGKTGSGRLAGAVFRKDM